MTLLEVGAWAQVHFKLHQAPSRAAVNCFLKCKESILSENNDVLHVKAYDRKRKRHVTLNDQKLLEEHLLKWVRHHDSTHGGAIPLPDAMIIAQAKIIAGQLDLAFDSKLFIGIGIYGLGTPRNTVPFIMPEM